MAAGVVRVAAIADLHCSKASQGAFQSLFARVSESADVVLIAGDLTDYGLPEEATVLARELTALRIPAAAVLGNHDVESGKATEVRQILVDAGLFVHEAVDEALKLEAALARLRTKQLVGLLHYSPIQETVEGEPLEIYPFLGS